MLHVLHVANDGTTAFVCASLEDVVLRLDRRSSSSPNGHCSVFNPRVPRAATTHACPCPTKHNL